WSLGQPSTSLSSFTTRALASQTCSTGSQIWSSAILRLLLPRRSLGQPSTSLFSSTPQVLASRTAQRAHNPIFGKFAPAAASLVTRPAAHIAIQQAIPCVVLASALFR